MSAGGSAPGGERSSATPDGEVLTALATAEHGAALAELFRRSSVVCACRFWHFEGGSNAWLERCASSPEQNEEEMLAALSSGSDEMRGLVALATEGRVIGWLKLAPASSLAKIYRQRPYAGLPELSGRRDAVYTVACLLVDGAWRRRGVARKLLAAGIEAARSWGATSVEAFPRRGEGLHDAELAMGPDALFAELGFEQVAEVGAYPVLRIDI